MPAGTGDHVKRPDEDEPTVDKKEQKLYRSRVGLLLYLVKLSRPDISNAVRELSKMMDRASPTHVKKLKRIIKYMLNTEKRVLNFDLREQEGGH